MEQLFSAVLGITILIQIVLIVLCVWRVWRAPQLVDRLIAADLIGTFTVAIFVLISIITRDPIYVDVAIVLGALGAIGTIAIAKYLADQRMF